MPEVIFDENMKSMIVNTLDGSGTDRFRDQYARIAIYTAGNGLSIINSFSTTTQFDAQTTGRLWFASEGNVTISYSLTGDEGAIQVSTGNIAASASGTAAEFLLYAAGSSTGVAGVIGGTVTSPGGGGDLVIADTSLVSGNNYRVQNWIVRIITDFSY